MTIDLKEKGEIDSARVSGGSTWSGEERRKHPGAEVEAVAYISDGGASIRCRVLNISVPGHPRRP